MSAALPALLELDHVGFSFSAREIIHDASLRVCAGELVALLGGNGAGKSTLLRLGLGLLRPSRGRVFAGGDPLERLSRREIARRLAYAPQAHAAAFPYLALDVVLLGRLAHGGLFRAPSDDDRALAARALADLGVAHLARRRYTELSGGERQMILLARALAQEARVLILDEPASGLDFGRQIVLLQTLRRLADDGFGVLMTTHHPDHALAAADRVVLLKGGATLRQGAAREIVTPEAIFDLYGVRIASVGGLAETAFAQKAS
ncbi:ABC transporter ATP-binding protein [Methylocella sp.]|uniref:ABC transporter ATP-binding protein n=1 Tax=Methylocella sp. TaxID=1978226 RepID=UPI0037844751